MDISVLKKENFEVWVPFGDDAKVLIAHVSRETLQKIAKKATKTTYVNHQKAEAFDPAEGDKLLGRLAIKNWEGFSEDGQPFPYTPENADLLMRKWGAFARFVNEACADVETLVKYDLEQVAKNSPITSGQDSTTRV